jgi:pimeloyl-ACP methyl ester carboxylesterase
MRKYMFTDTTPKALVEDVVKDATSFPPEISVAILEQNWKHDPRPLLKDIHVPIVAVNADKFPTNLEGNRRHAPQFDAVIMKGVGHYLLLEDPPRFGGLLDEALRKIGAKR